MPQTLGPAGFPGRCRPLAGTACLGLGLLGLCLLILSAGRRHRLRPLRLAPVADTDRHLQVAIRMEVTHQFPYTVQKLFIHPITYETVGGEQTQLTWACRLVYLQRSNPGVELLRRQFIL